MTLQYNIDQIVLRNEHIFCHGWGFVPGTFLHNVALQLKFEDGTIEQIDAQYGIRRDDVQAVFADFSEAQNSGFLLMASCSGRQVTSATIIWETIDTLALTTDIALPQPDAPQSPLMRLAYYRMLFYKSVVLLKTTGFRALWHKVIRYIFNRPHVANHDTWTQLKRQIAESTLCLIIDHDMGGGANIYRNEVIAQRCSNGETVLLLSFHVSTLQYFVEVFDKHGSRRYAASLPDTLVNLLTAGMVRQIIYNCAVSFSTPLQVPSLLMQLQHQLNAPLLILLHDYFTICPSHFLIDAEGMFCNVPKQSTCNECLSRHRDGFVSFSGIRDISVWRKKWGEMLAVADEIRIFSDSSMDILTRAYPWLDVARIRLMPHQLHTKLTSIPVEAGESLHIGIVGNIGRHKGAEIVANLAKEIVRRKATISITVIGMLEAKAPRNIVHITGPYEPADLPNKIQKSGANVFLLPSIWGETFSYVAHELVAMELPFACFDFGAQADLARSYERGLVIKSMEAPEIVNSLEELWRVNYLFKEDNQ